MTKHNLRSIGSCAVVLLFLFFLNAASVASARAQGNFSGTVGAGDPVGDRPTSFRQGNGCAPRDQEDIPYDLIPITLTVSQNLFVSLLDSDGATVTPAGADTFLALYTAGGYDPADPCANAVTANDDTVDLRSKIFTTTPLAPGNYFILVTKFSADDSDYAYTLVTGVPPPPPLKISEFRLSGPNGAEDEFIEIINASAADFTVPNDYGVASSSDGINGTLRCTIPAELTIPAGGYLLCANSNGYSLEFPSVSNERGGKALKRGGKQVAKKGDRSAPLGGGTNATPDDTYAEDISDTSGIGIFTSTETFNQETRLDSVGFRNTPTGNGAFKEGAGITGVTSPALQYSFVRDTCGKGGSTSLGNNCPTAGAPRDTDDNEADFYTVETSGASPNGLPGRLGAPGPHNRSAPRADNRVVAAAPLDPCVGSGAAPNRVRSSAPVANGMFGTLALHRTFTNATEFPITQLRFRVIDASTFPVPTGFADLRVLTADDVTVTVDRAPCGEDTSTVTVSGTTLDASPAQPNGGGFNSSIAAGTISFITPLQPGASIDLRFLLGVQQTGNFKFFVNIETNSFTPGPALTKPAKSRSSAPARKRAAVKR